MTLGNKWVSFDECAPLVGETILVRWPDGSIEAGWLDNDDNVNWLGVAGGDDDLNFLRDDGAKWRYVALD